MCRNDAGSGTEERAAASEDRTWHSASAMAGLLAGFVVAALAFLEPPAYLLGIPLLVGAAYAWVFSVAAISAITFTLAAGRSGAGDPAGVVAASVWSAFGGPVPDGRHLWSAVGEHGSLSGRPVVSRRTARPGSVRSVFAVPRTRAVILRAASSRQSVARGLCGRRPVFAVAGDEMATAVLSGHSPHSSASKLSEARPGQPARRRLTISAPGRCLHRVCPRPLCPVRAESAEGATRVARRRKHPQSRRSTGRGHGGDVPPGRRLAALDGTYHQA